MKKLFIYGACLLMGLGAVSCHGDDPLTNNVVAPVVPAAPNTLTGVVTDAQGNPVAGATVTLDDGTTTTTDENGVYTFENVTPGNHTITVEKDGSFTQERDVTVGNSDNTQTVTESFLLNKRVTSTVTIKNGVAQSTGEVVSETIPGNDKGKVEITADIESDAIVDASGNTVDDLEIYITPIYTTESAQVTEGTKAPSDEHDMLIGATLSCSKEGVVIKKPINIKFDLDDSVVNVVYSQHDTNGNWVNVDKNIQGGAIIIPAMSWGAYGLFIDMTVDTTPGTENLTFDPSEWNNINGASNVWAEESKYSYKAGARITSTATNALEGLLIEHLARKIGAVVTTIDATYPIKQSISVNAALRIWGNQQVTNWTLTGRRSNRSVKAVSYGLVNIFTQGWTREHNGGGSQVR